MGNLFNMFGRSPIRPLEKHMNKVNECAALLLPFFDAVLASNWPLAKDLQDKIVEFEHDADRLKKDLRLHLPKGLFLPVPRTDILELLSMQDRIANKAKDISGVVISRNMQLPTNISSLFIPFLKRCLEASLQACRAINKLDELLETGFRGDAVTIVEEMIVTLDEIEHDTDELQIDIRKHLFELESLLPAIEIMFLYKIIEWTGDLADRSQEVGGRLLILLAH